MKEDGTDQMEKYKEVRLTGEEYERRLRDWQHQGSPVRDVWGEIEKRDLDTVRMSGEEFEKRFEIKPPEVVGLPPPVVARTEGPSRER